MSDERKIYDVPLGTVAAKLISRAFSGWHSMSDDGTYKTTAAIVCNGLKQRILDSFGGEKQIIALPANTPKTALEVFYHTVYKGHSSASNVSIDRRMALFKPAVVWITGPASMSVPTLCALENYITPLPLYAVIRHKATTVLNQEIKTYTASRMHVQNAENTEYVKEDCIAEKLSQLRAKESYLTDIVDDIITETKLGVCSRQRATAVACMLHAMAVQHLCDIDAGAKFRDKRGRQAAFDELAHATKTLLYAT
jgi:hypothetical protein